MSASREIEKSLAFYVLWLVEGTQPRSAEGRDTLKRGQRAGSVDLGPGIHRIRVSYFQGPRFLVALVLQVAPPGEPLRIFSTDDFKPPSRMESVEGK